MIYTNSTTNYTNIDTQKSVHFAVCILMNIKIGILNEPKHCNKRDLIHFVTERLLCSKYLRSYWKERKKGRMDEFGFYVPSTVFQSFRDDGRVNMKGSVQRNAV